MNNSVRSVVCVIAFLPASAWSQANHRSWQLHIENDAFVNSDTGYTNGLRLGWTFAERQVWMPAGVMIPVPWVLSRMGLGPLFGLVPGDGTRACDPMDIRRNRRSGRCYLLNFSIAQTIYTPDDLLETVLEPRDRPFAGLLLASIGTTFLDSPRTRDSSSLSLHVMSQLTNEFVIGFTGPASLARETQSLAHWTWSASAERPRGWHNQLRGSLAAGFLTQLAVRPSGWEHCRNRDVGCNGGVDEQRLVDVTPRFETVLTTQMVRASAGIVLRAGYNFPDQFSAGRIAIAAPSSETSTAGATRTLLSRLFPGPHWGYGFLAADSRVVQHNALIEGTHRDTGSDGWKVRRLIDARHSVHEFAGGFAGGNRSMTVSGQLVFRTPEYDVRDAEPFKGYHRYVSLSLSINTVPR